jgi:dimethylglycine dehydrogenase
MQKHARAVIIGGGCVGAGILDGLARRGWSDIALLERTQLTAGSTWHAAGLVPSYTRNFNIGRMIAKTIEIYEGLEADTGQSVGWHKCGQLRLANSRERLDEFKSYMSVAEAQGTRAELLSPSEAKKLWPLVKSEHMLAALYNPDDGHIAPADVTQAMAKGARDRGAKVYLETEVQGFERTPGGEWKIITNRGDITCEHVICATGNYARQTGAMLGLDIPAIPIIHQYWITDAVPEIIERKRNGLPEMPILRDENVEGYVRQEGDGLMFGPYERTEKLKLFAEDGVPEWFGADLLEEDFDAVAPNWERATELLPALARAGIKANVRGPFQMTADELPLMGAAWHLDNVWLAEGVPGGILWGGAIGYYLSERIVEGGNSLDVSDLDPRRFGDYANKNWTRQKVREAWGTHALLHYPGESLPAARPQKTAPAYGRLTALGARWAVLNGWEIANWYAPKGVDLPDSYSWRWTPYDKYIGEEAHAVRNGVGLVDITPMTKFEVSGPSAEKWLDAILANRLPRTGAAKLCHQLTKSGGVRAEYMVARLADDVFYLISTPRAERWNLDELGKLLPDDGGVRLRNVTKDRGCFTIVGPKAREVLQRLTEIDLSNGAFPWFGLRVGTVGLASDVRVLRVNYEGELGWELYHPLAYQRHLLDELLAAGEPHGLRLVGLYALESLRLEKSYRAMYRDMNPELTAWESSLDRFIALDKGDFIGRDALLRQKASGIARRLVTLRIETKGASAIAHESVYHRGKLVGRVTSGGFAHTLGHDVAFALLPVEICAVGTELEVPILAELRKAQVIGDSPHDPKSLRCRG